MRNGKYGHGSASAKCDIRLTMMGIDNRNLNRDDGGSPLKMAMRKLVKSPFLRVEK